jgi:hypothetical protein
LGVRQFNDVFGQPTASRAGKEHFRAEEDDRFTQGEISPDQEFPDMGMAGPGL